MMSLEPDIVEIATEFLVARDFFDKIGYELIGTNDSKEDIIYHVRKKKL